MVDPVRADIFNHQGGSALVLVLWVVTLLSVVAGSFSLEMRREGNAVRNLLEVAQAGQLAEGGVHFAMLELLNTQPGGWVYDGREYPVTIDGHRVQVSVRDESGFVDLNTAPGPLLDGLLQMAGVEEDRRLVLVDAILDWRDPEPTHRLHGPGEADYRAAGYPYGARNSVFQGIEELQLVYGITPELYRRLEPWVTVYSGKAGVNPRFAPRAVLLAIPGVGESQVEAFLSQRDQQQDEGILSLEGADPAYIASGAVSTYRVRSLARLPEGTVSGVEAVLRTVRNDDDERPFMALAWKELAEVPPEGDGAEAR